MTEPYASTEVPVGRSQDQGSSPHSSSNCTPSAPAFCSASRICKCRVRFVWPTETGKAVVRLEVTPLPPGNDAARRRQKHRLCVDAAQRQRQAWRGLAWYLDATLKAATFGLVRFEDVFLSFIEDGATGRTIGEVLIPQIEAGRLALPRGGERG